MSNSPFDAVRDSNAGPDTAFGEPGDADSLLKAFAGGALAADQRPTDDDDEDEPQSTNYTYPNRRPGGRLGF
jgi:hypothetical protein